MQSPLSTRGAPWSLMRITAALFLIILAGGALLTWWTAVRAAPPPALLTLVLTAILLLGSALLIRRSRIADAPPPWMWHIETALCVVVGLVLTLFAAWMVHDNETHDHAEAFTQLASVQTKRIADALTDLRDSELEGLAHFYETNGHVTSGDFRLHTRHLAKKPLVQAWEWVPAVPAADKSRFKAMACSTGRTGFDIWQEDADGRRVPASGREVYYPVFDVAPLSGNESVIGFDLASEPLCRAALEEAARTALTTATDPITLLETGGQQGMLIIRPVFATGASKDPRGFVLAALRMDSLLQSADIVPPVSLRLSLLRQGEPPQLLATSSNAAAPPASGLSMTRPILAFGKSFAVTAHPEPAFLDLHPRHEAWIVLFGLTLTAALTAVIRVTLHRNEELARLVDAQTLELQKGKEKFQSLVEATSDWIWEVDAAGVYTYSSPQVTQILGYAPEEIAGKTLFDFMPPAEAARVATLFQQATRSRRPFTGLENTNLHTRGHVVVLETNGVPVMSADGCLLGYRGVGRDITTRKRTEEDLRRSSERNAFLLREIHHRVKNNLSQVIALVQIQGDAWERKYPDAEDAVTSISGRIESMALLHEHLYQAKNVGNVPASQYLGGIIDRVASSHDRPDVSIRATISPAELGIETAMPCGMLLNELLTNTFKHAFPDARPGIVRIGFAPDAGAGDDTVGRRTWRFTFEDDGVGCHEADLDRHESIGWRIIRLLCDQFKAKPSLAEPPGFKLAFSFREPTSHQKG